MVTEDVSKILSEVWGMIHLTKYRCFLHEVNSALYSINPNNIFTTRKGGVQIHKIVMDSDKNVSLRMCKQKSYFHTLYL